MHFFRSFLFSLLLAAVAIVSIGLGMVTVVGYQVFWGDTSTLERSAILARMNEETSIYTRDGKKRLGSFFDQSHRNYIPIDRVPAHMIRAMVASEDKNFYNHAGVDPLAITKAFVEGVQNGFRFRRGGSTITQQTVKNIMDRREHSFKRKFREMIRALQLEQLYDKNEILEFYLNQFHVTSNGNGIGIAAQYYFNKEVEDLSLVEAAFIAGSVKAPSKYNPFTRYTRERSEKARILANERKNYVLRRMYEQGWIEEEEFKKAWDEDVPFNKGKFTTRELALVSVLKGQLDKKEILDELGLESVEELNQAGYRIVTTIDGEMQEKAQLMMRRNLSRLELILDGFHAEEEKYFRPLRRLEANQFYFGKVARVHNKGKESSIDIDFGLPVGTIPYDSIVRTAKLLAQPTYKNHEFHVKEILDTLKVGDILLSEVKDYDAELHKATLELRAYPTMNGGLMAVDEGEVRAVVAGFEAKGFNRAMFAVRQPGSVFKSVVYFAALQLGWTILDRIGNERRLFPFQGHFYYPRPDHPSPFSEVSMIWAGVKSENLASIYLTAHLLDQLNFGQFKELLKHMNLYPQGGEAPQDYHYRVAKELGVQLNTEGIREHLLQAAIVDLKPDLVFSGHAERFNDLVKMWWGNGYLPELKNLLSADEEWEGDELQTRIGLLKHNFMRLKELRTSLMEDWQTLSAKFKDLGAEGLFSDPVTAQMLKRFSVVAGGVQSPSLSYARELLSEEEFFSEEPDLDLNLVEEKGRPLNPLDAQMIWGEAGFMGSQAEISRQDVLLDGVVPVRHLNSIERNIDLRFERVMALKDRYSLYGYFNHHDFRIALGLNYLVRLSKEMGVYNKLEPVLSFPLGTNVVSVAEVVKIYQTFVSGKTYRFYEDGPENQLNFVKWIEDRNGEKIYEPEVKVTQLVDQCYAAQMGEILGKVVTHGTGRRARGELQIPLDPNAEKTTMVRIPAFGKTGTTNDYRTAYFSGYMPYPSVRRAPLAIDQSHVIASYVGYDLNQSMRRGSFKITGARGALPIWSDFARAVLDIDRYHDYLDTLDLGLVKSRVWPLKKSSCGQALMVDLPRGIQAGTADPLGDEVFDATNIASEGESFVNEFARNSRVKTYLHVPLSGDRPKRSFALYEKSEEDTSDVASLPEVHDEDKAGGDLAIPPSEQPIKTTPRAIPADPDAGTALEPKPSGETLSLPLEEKKKPANPIKKTW